MSNFPGALGNDPITKQFDNAVRQQIDIEMETYHLDVALHNRIHGIGRWLSNHDGLDYYAAITLILKIRAIEKVLAKEMGE